MSSVTLKLNTTEVVPVCSIFKRSGIIVKDILTTLVSREIPVPVILFLRYPVYPQGILRGFSNFSPYKTRYLKGKNVYLDSLGFQFFL